MLIGVGTGAGPVTITVPVIAPVVDGSTGLPAGMATGAAVPFEGGLPPQATTVNARQITTASDRDGSVVVISVDSSRG
jgi:hypothetical protein